jgi:hypothetical protein
VLIEKDVNAAFAFLTTGIQLHLSFVLFYNLVYLSTPNIRVIPKTTIASSLIVCRILWIPLWITNSKEINPDKRASLSGLRTMFTITAFPKIVLARQQLKFVVKLTIRHIGIKRFVF